MTETLCFLRTCATVPETLFMYGNITISFDLISPFFPSLLFLWRQKTCQNYIYLMFKSIISRILNIELDEYENKKSGLKNA